MKIIDFENAKIRVIEDFISKEDCDYIINYANNLDIWHLANAEKSQFSNEKDYEIISSQWDNRKIDFGMLYGLQVYPELFKKVWENQERAKEEVLKFYGLNPKDITIEILELVRWYYPFHQSPHIDYLDETFTDEDFPEGYGMSDETKSQYLEYFRTKHFTTMMYLNEDFEGGEIFFPYHDIEIKPKPGMLVLFSGDAKLPHGIKQITSGTRYVNTTFWTKTPYSATILSNHDTRNTLNKFWD